LEKYILSRIYYGSSLASTYNIGGIKPWKKKPRSQKKANPANIHWGIRLLAVIVGFVVANIIVVVSALTLKSSQVTIFFIAFLIQPAAYFITGLLLGFWLGNLPKYEIVGVIFLGFVGKFIGLITTNTDSTGWVLFAVSVIISTLVAFGGAYCGLLWKKGITGKKV
jgi:hypothetical protein